MAIKAVISIVDDKSGRTYLKNHLLDPSHVSEFPGRLEHTRYDFSFCFNIVNEDILPIPSVVEGESSCLCNTCAKWPCVFRTDDRTECDLYVKEPGPYKEEEK